MDGPYRVDLHCHSSASYDGRIDPIRLAEIGRERGLTHIAITDHETIEGALAAKSARLPGITVIVGEEVRTDAGDLILLFVKEAIPGGLSAVETVKRARAQGALVGLPHPFDFSRPSVGRSANVSDERRKLASLGEYVEVHNGRVTDPTANARASDFSRQYGLPQVAVTDCHSLSEVGSAYIEVLRSPLVAAELLLGLAEAQAHVRIMRQRDRSWLDRLRGRA